MPGAAHAPSAPIVSWRRSVERLAAAPLSSLPRDRACYAGGERGASATLRGESRQGVAMDRAGADRPAPASSRTPTAEPAGAPSEGHVFAEGPGVPGALAHPVLKAAHPLEHLAGDEQVCRLKQPREARHPQRPVKRPQGGGWIGSHRTLDQVGLLEGTHAAAQPRGRGTAVGVEESNPVPVGRGHAGVARVGRPGPGDPYHLRDHRCGVGHRGGVVAGGVVHHHDVPLAVVVLLGQTGQRPGQEGRDIAGRDDDRDQAGAHVGGSRGAVPWRGCRPIAPTR